MTALTETRLAQKPEPSLDSAPSNGHDSGSPAAPLPPPTIMPPTPTFQPEVGITTLSLEELAASETIYNRELSWLDFNRRVLHEGLDPRTPLLKTP